MSDILTAIIEGGVPLVGDVTAGGSRSLALKIIYASILTGEECNLSNIPKSKYILEDLELASDLGVKAVWTGPGRLLIDSKDLSDFKIVPEKGSKVTTAAFLVPALVHKFGKAVLPKTAGGSQIRDRGVQFAAVWRSLGMEVKEDLENYYIEAVKLQSGEITLPYRSRILTDLAILSCAFVLGESMIFNASQDVETDDLIDFCNRVGAKIRRLDEGSVSVEGCGVFNGISYNCAFDREEAAFYILSALLTNGNISVKGLERSRLLPLLNWLSKTGANYEFSGSDMRVWHNKGDGFLSTDVTVLPHPGFLTDFQPLAVLFSCFADGESVVLENPLSANYDYVWDLNRLGARIEVNKGSESIELKVSGPANMKSGKISLENLKYALTSFLYALSVEGINEIEGYEIIEGGFENITDKLNSLGARIEIN